MKQYPATEQGFKEWEENYEDGDIIAVHSTEPLNWVDNVNQWGTGNKYPDSERYCHVEPVMDAEEGLSIRANGEEVVRANVDDYRNNVFTKKRALTIYRAVKTAEQMKVLYKLCLESFLYKDYDKKNIQGYIITNLGNFWRWMTRQKEVQNTIGDADKPVCSTVCFVPDYKCNPKIMEGVNVEAINPSNLVHDPAYTAIARIGGI